jgi:hypothetical protein
MATDGARPGGRSVIWPGRWRTRWPGLSAVARATPGMPAGDMVDNKDEIVVKADRSGPDQKDNTSFRNLSHVGCVMLRKVVLLFLFAFVLPHSLQAAEFFCSAGDVACVIAAVNSANNTPEEDTIILEPGTYPLTTDQYPGPDPRSTGLPSITSTVTVRGAGADRTIVERDGAAPSFRLFHVASTGSLILDGITLRGGTAGTFEGVGGAIFSEGTLSVKNSVLTENSLPNSAISLGGAIYGSGVTTVTNTTFVGNFA